MIGVVFAFYIRSGFLRIGDVGDRKGLSILNCVEVGIIPAVRNLKDNVCQIGTLEKSTLPDKRHILRDDHLCQQLASTKCILANFCYACGNNNTAQCAATAKSHVPNLGKTARQRNACNGFALLKRVVFDFCNLLGNDQLGQQFPIQIKVLRIIHRVGGTVFKGNFAPAHQVGNVNVLEICAIIKCTIANGLQA